MSRLLEAEVAVKVMGWTAVYSQLGKVTVGELSEHDVFGQLPTDNVRRPIPQYTTNPLDAWQVVRNLNARGWLVNIDANPDGTGGATVLQNTGPDEWSWIGISKIGCSVETAICQAALQAVSHG